MNHPANLQSLSSTVGLKVTELSNLLKTAGLPEPSFAERSYDDFAHETTSSADNAIRQVRNDLIDAAKDIIRLAMGPIDQILSLAWSVRMLGITRYSKMVITCPHIGSFTTREYNLAFYKLHQIY